MSARAKSTIRRLCVESPHPKGAGTVIRDATTEEVCESAKLRGQLEWLRKEEERIHKRINELERGCKHTVVYDDEGWPCDIRLCHACGKTMGMI